MSEENIYIHEEEGVTEEYSMGFLIAVPVKTLDEDVHDLLGIAHDRLETYQLDEARGMFEESNFEVDSFEDIFGEQEPTPVLEFDFKHFYMGVVRKKFENEYDFEKQGEAFQNEYTAWRNTLPEEERSQWREDLYVWLMPIRMEAPDTKTLNEMIYQMGREIPYVEAIYYDADDYDAYHFYGQLGFVE